MVKPFVHALCLTLTLLVLLSYIESTEAAKQKRMIIGFSGGKSGAENGNLIETQNGEIATDEEIKAAIAKAKLRIAMHMEKIKSGTARPRQIGNGGKVQLRIQ